MPTVVVGLRTPILMEDPVIRGTRSLFWQGMPIKPPRNAYRGWPRKTGLCWARHGVRAHSTKIVSRSDLWSAMLSTVVCGNYLTELDTILNLLWSIRRWNPPCNAEDKLHAGLIVIEAWFRGYEGVLD